MIRCRNHTGQLCLLIFLPIAFLLLPNFDQNPPSDSGTAPSPPQASLSPVRVIIEASGLRKTIDGSSAEAVKVLNKLIANDPGAAGVKNWARFSNRLLHVQMHASVPLTNLFVFSSESDIGKSVAIINQTGVPIQSELQMKLKKGIFTISRLIMPPQAPSPQSVESASFSSADSPPIAKQWLEGAVFSRNGIVKKPCFLPPGSAVLYRFTNRTLSARSDYYTLLTQLHQLAIHHPGPARKMRRMLEEGVSDIHTLYERDISGLHPALLAVGQAQTFHHDMLFREALPANILAPIGDTMEHLIDNLSRTGAVLMGLVPSADSKFTSTGANRTVTVSLANTGSHTVAIVKLFVQSDPSLKGIICQPSDAAVFRELRPGQTVTASYQLSAPAGVTLKSSSGIGDISYTVEGGPARFLVRPW